MYPLRWAKLEKSRYQAAWRWDRDGKRRVQAEPMAWGELHVPAARGHTLEAPRR